MLRALKKSFTCTARQRKGSHSRQRSILLHMAECASTEKDLDIKDSAMEGAKRPPKGHESRRSRHNSTASIIGRNNSMNDWQEIVSALKNVDRSRHNSSEQGLDVTENDPIRAVAPEEDPATSESQRQLSNNVASRLTPSATPLLHRKSSFDGTKVETDSGGERFISEYNVRLEPVIKICIPCQHDHAQFHAQPPTARVTSNSSTEAIDADANGNSAAALMMRSINMAPPRVEVAVETPEAEIAAAVLSAETAAGDENFSRLALEPPPPTPEIVKTVAPSPTPEVSDSNPQVIAGNRFAANTNAVIASSTNQPAAFVEVGEWTKGDSPATEEKIEMKKEEKQTMRKDEEEENDELMEPASASEVETSRQEVRTLMTSDTAAHVEALILESELKDSATAAECPEEKRTITSERGETPNFEKEETKEEQEVMENSYADEEDDETVELEESKQFEFEREGSPTSTSIASFVDVYDKEPLHPIDDSKTTMNPLRRSESRDEPKRPQSEHSNDSDVRAAPWLGANEPTTSADRWKRMKQIVREREAAVAESPVVGAEGESQSVEVDSRLQTLMKNLTAGVRKAPVVEDGLEASINAELRHILSTLGSQDSPQQRRESKSSSPKLLPKQAPNKQSPPRKLETKPKVAKKVGFPPRRELSKDKAHTSPMDEAKRRTFSIQMELDSSDAVVCSFLRPADRRVVAAAAKNNCTVSVSAVEDQPSKVMRKFLCVVRGPTRDQVTRCINFLKDTFPKSYIRYNR